jgi:twinkle protein
MDTQQIKERLNSRAEDFVNWLFPAGRKNGNEWLVGSLNGEPGKSLAIRVAGPKVGVWSDFATGDSGSNLLELYIQTGQVDCAEAIRACAEWLGEPLRQPHQRSRLPSLPAHARSVPSSAVPSESYSPSDDECQQVMSMIARMCDDAALREQLAKARGWKADTLKELALEGYLGWSDKKLAFIYDTGVKLRWRQDGERIIRWAFGKPWLWRGAYLIQAETVYLCEGETDAIALIDAGVEEERGTIAVALPSASTFNASWTELFKGKDVILVLDGDPAGENATQRVSKLLSPVVRSLNQLKWEGLQHAS